MLKAIPTHYRGYHFRSRLEARWAVFFDALGLQWEYEPQGFELSDGTLYLPDFKLLGPHGIHQWVEVKPHEQSNVVKHDRFAAQLDNHLACSVVVKGDPVAHFEQQEADVRKWRVDHHGSGVFSSKPFAGLMCPRCGTLWNRQSGESLEFEPVRWRPSYEYHYSCFPCDMTTPCGDGHEKESGALAKCTPRKGWMILDEVDSYEMFARIRVAAKAARSARFEHGESGSTL